VCERAGKGPMSLMEFRFFSILEFKPSVSIVVMLCAAGILYTSVSYVPHKDEGSLNPEHLDCTTRQFMYFFKN
jgi:hypothetical protein